MDQERRIEVRQDIVDAQYGSGGAGGGPSAGQVLFDLIFGLAAPIALMLADPALFVPDVADRAALPPYWATPIHIATAGLLASLVAWGVTGMRHPVLGLLLAGPFAAGAIIFLVLGLKLLWFALAHAELLSGWLAFTPWATAFVFARHCVLACRAAAHRSAGIAVVALVLTSGAILVTLGAVGAARGRKARLLESMLLSEDTADFEQACATIHSARELDMDSVAEAYAELKENDPRRGRLKDAYLRLAGESIEDALHRLFPRRGEQGQALPATPTKARDDPRMQWVTMLFSEDWDEHKKAADELVTIDPDPNILDAIVLRYSRLPESDPRRHWVEKAYTSISNGDPIQHALEQLRKKSPPKHDGPRPPAKATKAKTPSPAPQPPHDEP